MAHQQQQSPFGTSSGYFRTFSQHSGSATPQGTTTAPPGSFRDPPAIDSPAMASRTTPEASSSTPHTAGPSPKGAPTPPSMTALPSSSSVPGSSSQAKRKRKDGKGKANTVDQSEEDEAEKAKRTKTQRACDPCRRKKIRCDIITDSEPPICQHCSQYRYDCTFYLPITETRFKKKRMEEAAAAAAASNGSNVDVKPVISRGPSGDDAPNGIASGSRVRGDLPMTSAGESSKEVKIYGPTSLSFIMHSTPSIPVKAFENYDARYQETWEVGKTGDGFIQVTDHSPPQHPVSLAKNPLEYHRLDREVLASLINAYFQEVAPQFPIVSEAEFLSTPSPPPVLLYAICSVAAARRGVPNEVFDTLRAATAEIIILLYETTQLPQAAFNHPNNPQRLNPTVGVSDRPPGTENFRKLKFTKDPTRPGGGVFVADDKALAEAVISDLPLGTVVFVQAEDKDGRPASGVGPVNKIEDGAPNAAGGHGVNSASDEVTSLLVNIAPLQTAMGGGPSSSNSAGPTSAAATGNDHAQRFGSIFGPSSFWNSIPDLTSGQVPADFPVGAVDGFSGAIPATKPQPSTAVSNVNPSMNYNYAPVTSGAVNGWQQLGNGGVQVLNLLDQPLDGSVVPYQMLQGIPFDTFNTGELFD
ncbi:hypothetical protein FRC00_012413 [Tulasnella sp. 408]|nr:hypothetical protein FRC00_012413 [Tulasnella sp. 408]